MIITLHAAKRVLERVICKSEFTDKDLQLANNYLSKVVENIVPNSFTRPFALPGFENKFYVIHKQNTVITIIPKDKNQKETPC